MSAPALIVCSVAVLGIGLPVVAASAHLEAQRYAAAAADAAALAAVDAAQGWIAGEPCALAAEVAGSMEAEIVRCDLEAGGAEARIVARVSAHLWSREAAARAGVQADAPVAGGAGERGQVGPGGWAWPSAVRGITQHFHDGLSIDLEAPTGSALYAPYDGVVVMAGFDGGGVPAPCVANPSWWRGPNASVMIRHEYRGRVLYSSHNHVAPGSPQRWGVVVGSRVAAGQRVADAGMSGCTEGPHTHFTLSSRPSNAFPDVDPFDYIGQP
ncbi:MAG: M23 family metallopeptidase [Leucobacter sp.]